MDYTVMSVVPVFSVLLYFNNIFFLLVEVRFIIYPTSGILLRPRSARSQTCKKVLAMFVLSLRLYLFCI